MTKLGLLTSWAGTVSAGLLVIWLMNSDQAAAPTSMLPVDEPPTPARLISSSPEIESTLNGIESEATKAAEQNYGQDLVDSNSNDLQTRTASYRASLKNALTELDKAPTDKISTDDSPESNLYSPSELALKESLEAEQVAVKRLNGGREVTEIYQRGGQGINASAAGAQASLKWLEGLASTDPAVVSLQLVENLTLKSERCIGTTCVYNYERRVGELVAWDHEIKVIKNDGTSARVKGLVNAELNAERLTQTSEAVASLDSRALAKAFESHYSSSTPIALENEPERGIILGEGMLPNVVGRVIVSFSPIDKR